MKYYVLTLFPDLIRQITSTSILGRGVKSGAIEVETVNIRDFATRSSMRIDDYPYGGGAGIVMEPEPVYQAVRSVEEKLGRRPRVIYLTPQARVLDQTKVEELAREEELILLCGHYEGIDERVLEEVVTDYISIGDYVLTGGELGAAVIIDAVSRFIPGVLNNDESTQFESFQDNLLEYPHYTRPEEWHGRRVPEVLLSGNHEKIEEWRHEQSLIRTRERRPELLEKSFTVTGIWYGTDAARETAQSLTAQLSRYGTVLDYGRKKLQKMHRSFGPQDLLILALPQEGQGKQTGITGLNYCPEEGLPERAAGSEKGLQEKAAGPEKGLREKAAGPEEGLPERAAGPEEGLREKAAGPEAKEMTFSERFRNLRGASTPVVVLYGGDETQRQEAVKYLWESGFSVIEEVPCTDTYRTPEGCAGLSLKIRKKILQ